MVMRLYCVVVSSVETCVLFRMQGIRILDIWISRVWTLRISGSQDLRMDGSKDLYISWYGIMSWDWRRC